MWVHSLGWKKSPGEENGHPLQYFCLENSMDRGAWQAAVHVVAKCWTHLKQLSMHTHTHISQAISHSQACHRWVGKYRCTCA